MNSSTATADLPDWLKEILPEHSVPGVLSAPLVDGVRVLRHTDPQGKTSDYGSVKDFADDLPRSHRQDLLIEDEVYEHFSGGKRFLRYPADRDGYVGAVMASHDGQRQRGLERAYTDSKESIARYRFDPESFFNSWQFIDRHPAFWTSFDFGKHPWHWETEGYCSKLRQFVAIKDGELKIYLEAGGHVELDLQDNGKPFSEHYMDWRLHADGANFEEAIIDLARRVSWAFSDQGDSLPEEDFPEEPPRWIRELRESDSAQ